MSVRRGAGAARREAARKVRVDEGQTDSHLARG